MRTAVKEAVQLVERPEVAELRGYEEDKLVFARVGLCNCFPDWQVCCTVLFEPEDREKILHGTAEWLFDRPDPLLRVHAIAGAIKIAHRWVTPEMGLKGLDILANELPPLAPDGTEDISTCLAAKDTFEGMYQRPDLIVEQAERLIRPMMEPEHARLLLYWHDSCTAWMEALEALGRTEEAYQLGVEVEKLLASVPPEGFDGQYADATRKELRRTLEALRDKLGLPGPFPEALAGWSFASVRDAGPAEASPFCLNEVALKDDRLFLLWHRGFTVRLTCLPLDGTGELLLGETEVRAPTDSFHPQTPISFVMGDADTWYTAINGGGIVRFGGGRAAVWTEAEGLPTVAITAMDHLGGKFYIGTSGGGLAAFDPERGRSVTIASARAQEKRGPLDGPPDYTVRRILADPERNCLWLGIVGDQRDGMWRYVPATGEMEKVLEMRPRDFRWWRGRFLVCAADGNWYVVDPERAAAVLFVDDEQGTKARGAIGPATFHGRRILWPGGVLGGKFLFWEVRMKVLSAGGGEQIEVTHAPEVEDIKMPVSRIIERGDDVLVAAWHGRILSIGAQGGAEARAAIEADLQRKFERAERAAERRARGPAARAGRGALPQPGAGPGGAQPPAPGPHSFSDLAPILGGVGAAAILTALALYVRCRRRAKAPPGA